jgi:hypothetical protein
MSKDWAESLFGIEIKNYIEAARSAAPNTFTGNPGHLSSRQRRADLPDAVTPLEKKSQINIYSTKG